MKNAVILFLFSYITSSLACSVTHTASESLKNNPAGAKTFFYGQIEGDKENMVIIADSKFYNTLVKIQIRTSTSDDCLRLVGAYLNKRHLFLSELSINDLSRVEPTMLNSTVTDFSNISFSFLDTLVKIKEFPKGFTNIFWGFCRKDKDCTKVKSVCGEIGISKKYQSLFESYIKEKPNTKCSNDMNQLTKDISKCVGNICS